MGTVIDTLLISAPNLRRLTLQVDCITQDFVKSLKEFDPPHPLEGFDIQCPRFSRSFDWHTFLGHLFDATEFGLSNLYWVRLPSAAREASREAADDIDDLNFILDCKEAAEREQAAKAGTYRADRVAGVFTTR